ncbi:hypothetical protein GKR48_14315 [Providencia sp. wls1943]|uniref:phage tail fiber protein n=1 Tax=Providencia sp. wls1943 TaxID=2675150 RepID=UPI0012B64FE3|nr:hypothetical protein [Providencia sp. wls1943]MTB67979.1 hypothetical protein [Providencia sp. wls1943]
MIYQTGTIKTTAGQTKITGTGTRWKDNLAGISEGCPISYLINNVVYMNTILSVNSDTEINLTYPVTVAASAAKYQIATFVLDSMSDGVRKMLANQQYIQYFLRNMDTWLTQDGIVEIKTPTGETVRLESIIALKKLIDDKFDKKGGGISGAIDVGGNITSKNDVIQVTNERTGNNIQLDTTVPGTARLNTQRKGGAWKNHVIPDASGTLMQVGDCGLGDVVAKYPTGFDLDNALATGSWDPGGSLNVNGAPFGCQYAPTFTVSRNTAEKFQLAAWQKDFFFRYFRAGAFQSWGVVYSTLNTIKDANGNIKAASPVIKVFTDDIEPNEEAEGVELEKLGTGRYKLKGTLGMNSDASWGGIHGGLVVPNGINNLPLVWADFDVLPDGDIIIETRYRKHTLHPRLEAQRLMTYPEFLDENNIEREDYDYCDIPNGHWIDVRVNMPSDSIYNQKLAEAERLAKIEAERVAKEEVEKAAREEAERLEEESKQEQASKLEE